MTDLRDNITAVVDDAMIDSMGDYSAVPDAIIAALPDMVAPLVWVKHPSADIWRCYTTLGQYKVFAISAPTWDFDGIVEQTTKTASSEAEAKFAASAHHAAAVVAAFRGETT